MMKLATVALISLTIACRSAGQGTVLGGPQQFQGATTLLTFETFPDGSSIPYASANVSTQWTGIGVLVSDSTPEDSASAYAGTRGVFPHSGTNALGDSAQGRPGTYLVFSFVDSNSLAPAYVTEVGLWLQNGDFGSQVVFYDRENRPLQTVSTSGIQFFAGLRYEGGISAIRVNDPDFFLADDLQFSAVMVPEPGVWALLLLGGAGLFASVWRPWSRRRIKS